MSLFHSTTQTTHSPKSLESNLQNWQRLYNQFAVRPARRYLRVGSFDLLSTLWLVKNIVTRDSGELIHVDSSSDTDKKLLKQELSKIGFSGRVEFRTATLQVDSRQLSLNQFDIVHVDAKLNFSTLLTNAVLAWNLLKSEGLFIFEDNAGVLQTDSSSRLAIDCFITGFRNEVRVLHRNRQVWLRKVKRESQGICYGVILGKYVYSWKHKLLYYEGIPTDIPLSEQQVLKIEEQILARELGTDQITGELNETLNEIRQGSRR